MNELKREIISLGTDTVLGLIGLIRSIPVAIACVLAVVVHFGAIALGIVVGILCAPPWIHTLFLVMWLLGLIEF